MYPQNISAGMKLWGVVAEVNEKDLVICLPGGLRGLARAADALDPILDNEIEVMFYYYFHFLKSVPNVLYSLYFM